MEEVIIKLAEIFCTTADFVQANFWEFVLEYGKYRFWSEFPWVLFLSAAIAFLLALCVAFAMDEACIENTKIQKTVIVVFVVASATGIILASVPYIISPEMYSLEAVMQLVSAIG